MKLIGTTSLLSAVALFAALTGCASTARDAGSAEDVPTTRERARAASAEKSEDRAASKDADADTDTASDAESRKVGDYVTFSFSGAYRKEPLRLTQRVVARAADSITIDYSFTEAHKSDVLRVTVSTAKKTRGDVTNVEHVQADGSTAPATKADLETKMAATAAFADENEALVDERQTKVKVGDSEVTATQSRYKVRVGKKAATLETVTSDAFAWGDLGGKITTTDGKVLFHAELVDAGGPSSARASLD
ncbi:MAG: hypothetical protein HOW73_37470 [Polyangiaceae bacterium]|nr:hypothetical protein [Polyangiaceae bacterium]